MAVKLSWLFDRTCRPDGACGNWHSQFYKHYLVSICLDFDTGFDGFDTSWFRYVTSFLLNPSHFVPRLLNPAPLRTQPKSFRATQSKRLLNPSLWSGVDSVKLIRRTMCSIPFSSGTVLRLELFLFKYSF